MKLKLIILFFSFLSLLLLVNACKKRRDEPQPKATVLYGKVINRKTGDPIKGAEISFQDHEYATPSSGSYRFHEMAGEYPLITNHDDYHKDSINVVLKSNKELMKDRFLVPKRSIVHATHQDDLHFESTTDTLVIEIENAGIEESLIWKAESNRAWLIISPTQGTIHGEGSMSLEITIDIDKLTAEKDTGIVTITNGTYVEQSIEVSVCAEKDNIEVVEDPMESLSEGLVAYYPFNGDANDESGNAHNGVVNGASLVTDRKGNINSAYEFDGLEDGSYIEVANNMIDFNTVEAVTISGWFYPDTIYQHELNTYVGIQFGNKQNGLLSIRVRDESVSESNNRRFQSILSDETHDNTNNNFSNQEFDYDAWYYVVGVFKDNSSQLYVNGILQTDIIRNNNTGSKLSDISSNLPLHIGKAIDTGSELGEQFFHGKLDDIRIYNRALTEEEIIMLYNE